VESKGNKKLPRPRLNRGRSDHRCCSASSRRSPSTTNWKSVLFSFSKPSLRIWTQTRDHTSASTLCVSAFLCSSLLFWLSLRVFLFFSTDWLTPQLRLEVAFYSRQPLLNRDVYCLFPRVNLKLLRDALPKSMDLFERLRDPSARLGWTSDLVEQRHSIELCFLAARVLSPTPKVLDPSSVG